jgi:hypothetical protein
MTVNVKGNVVAEAKAMGYHPGYDESANGRPLYDLEGLNFSLYYWEVER